MARPRKPLDQQTGHLTQDFQKRRKVEEAMIAAKKSALEQPPTWLLDKVARDEWKRVVEELDDLEMVGNLDYDNIGGFCNAFSMYVKISKQLKKTPILLETKDGPRENPLIATQKKYAEEMRQFAKLIGLTIDSRLKFASEKTKVIDETISEEFGAI